MAKLESFRDLRVYQELKELHLMVHKESLAFPKFELYELGSQIRRSSNSAPANIAEGWSSRHTNVYIESVGRALGEIQETQHHLSVARDKGYLSQDRFQELDARYKGCSRMLEKLNQSLSEWRDKTRTGRTVREQTFPYLAGMVESDDDQNTNGEKVREIGFVGASPAPETRNP